MADPVDDLSAAGIKVRVLNLAGSEVAELLVSGRTSVKEIKRKLEQRLKEEQKFFPVCLQDLSCGHQKLEDASSCESLSWKDGDDVSIYLTRSSVDIEKCLPILWSAESRSKAAALEFHEIEKLCAKCEEIFQHEPMLLETSGPLTVVGNIHGHFEQLLKLFEQFGTPDKRRYLFLGGYVNKGPRSLDTTCLLFLYKAQQPENLLLLRSNHEEGQMSRIYGFYDECKKRHSVHLWKNFCRTFNMMPVCALVNEKIFCVHGGISPELKNLDQIRQLERPCAVPESGLLCDLLWADPARGGSGWGENDRGVSVTFGADVAKDFVTKFKLELICRSHEVVEDGVAYFADWTVVTLWSVLRFKAMETPHIAAVMVVMEDGQRTFEFVRD
ncbi:unnamed protein product [Cladocopium goreaui]|uniref:protein-serine/threonine phosphatase n=1 Tax=Cladocopium goreaui TaxID=2562237 RepID=A0A9P1DHJ1_9DINO|nr:unnamed protein product [Cladocopium goreaui]